MKAVRISSKKYLEYKMSPAPKSNRDPATKALLTPAEAYIRGAKGEVEREWKDRYKNVYALFDSDGKDLHVHFAIVATEAGMDAAVALELVRHTPATPTPDQGIGAETVSI